MSGSLKQEVFSVLGAQVTAYLPSATPDSQTPLLPATIVCPGGGYQKYGVLEGHPVAMALYRAGFCVFVLSYGIGPDAAHALPLRQLSYTVSSIRKQFRHFGVDPNRIFVMGFSAGGHLAANLGTLWNHPLLSGDGDQNRPDALCLCYPVVSLLHRPHQGTNQALLSGADEDLASLLSAERQVTSLTPPTFLWHGLDDRTVSPEHSVLFAEALERFGVPHCLKLFPHAEHGCGLADSNRTAAEWFPEWLSFLNRMFGTEATLPSF